MNVYDFDNTIYKGDSTADFYLFCLKRHKKMLLLTPSLLNGTLKHYAFGSISKTRMKENMYRFLTKIELERDLADFWRTHRKNIKPWYLINQKSSDVVISASPEFLLRPICKSLGIKTLIASKVDPKTGVYDGENVHGAEKVRLFNELIGGEIDRFYSDSESDRPLAVISRKAFMVKGNKITEWVL